MPMNFVLDYQSRGYVTGRGVSKDEEYFYSFVDNAGGDGMFR